jgi:formate-dependent nitrite reductase membrane component NrfD
MMHPPVWTWEVPVYFWLGGLAAGASFVAAAADAAGDEESAVVLRRLALGAAIPCAPLLIADLGRPLRFLHMLRVFKPRSPMSMGAWCLAGFSTTAAGAVGADLAGRRGAAKRLGALTAFLGTYLGSYTGALLAATAVPVWARSRGLIGPIFVCTAVGSGASAARLVLPEGPTRAGARRVATAAMAAELAMSHINERRLGELAPLMHSRRFRLAQALTFAGLVARRVSAPLFVVAALLFRFAWMEAGRASARSARGET